MKFGYVFFPLWFFLVALVGSAITSAGMGWYETITLPSWTPPGGVIGIVWTTIFILSALSGILFSKWSSDGVERLYVVFLFIVNGLLNVLWSFLFFGLHFIDVAVFEAALLGFSVVLLMFAMYRTSRVAMLLLLPYGLWVSFATYLTYVVWTLN